MSEEMILVPYSLVRKMARTNRAAFLILKRHFKEKNAGKEVADAELLDAPVETETKKEPGTIESTSSVSESALKILSDFGIDLKDAKELTADELMQINGMTEEAVKEILGE